MPTSRLVLLNGIMLCILMACGSTMQEQTSGQSEQASNASKQSPMSLPPQTARVTATVVTTETHKNGYVCTLKIRQVRGYGSSTPPLPEGTEIQALARESLVDMAGAKGQSLLKESSEVDVSVSYQKTLIAVYPPPPSWRITEIH